MDEDIQTTQQATESAPPQTEPQVDIAALQAQLTQAQNTAAQYQQSALAAQIAQQATLTAITLGVDVKTVPYVLKMADMSAVKLDKNGTLDAEAIQAAINKVLEDIPVLKPQKDEGSKGFRQIGGSGSGNNQTTDDALRSIFGIRNKK